MSDTDPAAARRPARRGLLRRAAGRARREAGARRRVTVRQLDPDLVRVTRLPGRPPRRYRLADPGARVELVGGAVTLVAPDPAALTRLAACGLLAGEVHRLRLRLASAPPWLLTGVRPARLAAGARELRWARRRGGLVVELRWARPYPLPRALADLLAAVLRARPWGQTSGPVYALDRAAWLAGASSWPQGRLCAAPPGRERDPAGRPLGPYLTVEPPATVASPLVIGAVANPYGRVLVGSATRYRLAGGPDRPLLQDPAGRTVLRLDSAGIAAGGFDKYAVVSVASPVAADSPAGRMLPVLAACGAVFAGPDPRVRESLATLGLVVVADPATVDDLAGYALSVAAARRALVAGDPALRRTALAGDGAVPLPAVSAVLASMREEHIEDCLSHLAGQSYPALEVVLGLHGYDVPERTRQRWRELLPGPLRVLRFPAELTLGAVLGQLSRRAEGELLTKVDDDDHYGPDHVTDLVIARHTSGADLVAKGARFVHLRERGETIDRAWAAPERFDVTPAGGTMLLGRDTLLESGGWSHSSRHVDADLLARVRGAGGLVYRTHALEYVYVRHGEGHTFATATERLRSHAERTYRGLPGALLRPAAA